MKKLLLIKAIIFSLCMCLTGCGEESPQPDEVEEKEKQEITIAVYDTLSLLYSDVFEGFNEQSTEYYITVLSDKSDYNAFREKIMKEIESGKGPDIVTLDYVNVFDYIAAGYLQPWYGAFSEEEKEKLFLPGVFGYGMYDDKLYGFPYLWTAHVLISSSERCNGLEEWDIKQMQECVKNTDAKCLASSLNGMDLVNSAVLCDKSNRDFIDWDKKTCNFMQQEFYDFLKFAKNYEVKQEKSFFFDDKSGIKNGEEFGWYANFAFCNMNYYEAVFGGEVTYIGFPTGYTENLFLNSSCENKDGAYAFLRYLLSEDVQNMLVKEQVDSGVMGSFSIRKDAMDYHIELEKTARQKMSAFELFGELYGNPAMTDKQEVQARKLMERVVFYNNEMSEIYVCTANALYGYFYGEQTEEETAALVQQAMEEYLRE